jgi:hypothetical protein
MGKQELIGHRSRGQPQGSKTNAQGQAVYATCLDCKRHPHYPHIAPVTRHVEGICMICGAFSKYAL